eukprot:6321457-Amphidinium_carterae.1
MAPKAKAGARAKGKARAKAVARIAARGLPALPAPLVPERWYGLPAGQEILTQLRTGQLLQVEVDRGTLMAEILGVHPRDAEGVFVEIGYRGGSTESIQRWGRSAQEQGRDLLLHLCTSARGCRANVADRL